MFQHGNGFFIVTEQSHKSRRFSNTLMYIRYVGYNKVGEKISVIGLRSYWIVLLGWWNLGVFCTSLNDLLDSHEDVRSHTEVDDK